MSPTWPRPSSGVASAVAPILANLNLASSSRGSTPAAQAAQPVAASPAQAPGIRRGVAPRPGRGVAPRPAGQVPNHPAVAAQCEENAERVRRGALDSLLAAAREQIQHGREHPIRHRKSTLNSWNFWTRTEAAEIGHGWAWRTHGIAPVDPTREVGDELGLLIRILHHNLNDMGLLDRMDAIPRAAHEPKKLHTLNYRVLSCIHPWLPSQKTR